jgi:outer membrane protein TolC
VGIGVAFVSRDYLGKFVVGTWACVVLATPASAQDALTLGAALDEAVYFNLELIALRRDAGATRPQVLLRANDILGDVRRAYADLTIAREGLAINEAQAPALREMANVATARYGSGEAGQQNPTGVLVELTRLTTERITWQERVRIAEVRLNALLGRRLDQPFEPLAERNLSATPDDSEQVALRQHPLLALADADILREQSVAERAAALARREVVANTIRQRVREARIRLDASRERVLLIGNTLMPQLQQAYDVAQVSYSSNRGSLMDLLNSHHRLLEGRVEYAAAYADFDRALVGLAIATGEDPLRIAPAVRPVAGDN